MFHKQNFEIRFFLSKSENDGTSTENGDVIMIVKSPYQSSILWTFCYSLDPDTILHCNISDISHSYLHLEEDSIISMASKLFSSRYLFEIYNENFSLHTILSMQQSYQSSQVSLSFLHKSHQNITLKPNTTVLADVTSRIEGTSLNDIEQVTLDKHRFIHKTDSHPAKFVQKQLESCLVIKTVSEDLFDEQTGETEHHNSKENDVNSGLFYISNQMERDLKFENETLPQDISLLRNYLFSV